MDLSYHIINSFTVVDSSTGKQKGGNGAVVLFAENKDQFSDDDQIEIAKNFPEYTEIVIVYPCPKGDAADFGMRYWSPQRLCEYSITGHPTIAAACGMVIHGHSSLASEKTSYVLETKAGLVTLDINSKEQKVYMGQIQPEFQDVLADDEREIHEIFGLKTGDILSPIKAVNMGLGYFIFQVRDVPTLMAMDRNLSRLVQLNKKYGLNGGAQPFAETDGVHFDLRTRNLDLRPANSEGVWLEDTACGQGSASLMAYLMKYMNHSGDPVRMEQGVPSVPCCVEAFGTHDGTKLKVFIGGTAAEISEGKIECVNHTVRILKQTPKVSCALS